MTASPCTPWSIRQRSPTWPAGDDSVRAQTDQGFDLWVSLDGLRPEQAVAAIGLDPGARWSIADAGSSPAALAARHAGAIGERPTRRWSSPTATTSSRLPGSSGARAGSAGADVVGVRARIIDEAGRDLGSGVRAGGAAARLGAAPRRGYNVFGLSNSAYRSEVLRALPSDAAGRAC